MYRAYLPKPSIAMTVCYMFSVTCYNPSNGSIRPLCVCVDCATLSSLSWTERLSPGDFKAEAFIFTCLTTPAVLNEFCGDYSHGYFWNGFKSEISVLTHIRWVQCALHSGGFGAQWVRVLHPACLCATEGMSTEKRYDLNVTSSPLFFNTEKTNTLFTVFSP